MLCVISSSTSFLPLSDFMYSSTCFGHTPRRTAGWSQGERRARRWVPGVRPSPYHGQTGLLANLSQQREVAEDHARDPGAAVGLAGERDARGGRDGAVDPGEAAVGVDGDLLAGQHVVGDAHEA